MRLRFFTGTSIFLLCGLLWSGQFKLYGGETRNFNRLELFRGKFIIDGETYSKADIGEIIFAEKVAISEEQVPSEQYDTDSLLALADSLAMVYPDVPGIIIYDHGEMVLHSDGTRKYRYHFAGKIQKASRLGWGTRSLFINQGRSNVRVLFARSILPDGNILYADTSQAKITPVSEDRVSFGYGSIYTLQIPGVQEGSIVEYLYETETYNPYDTAIYSPSWYFQNEDPVYSSRVIIRLPKPKNLYYLFKNPPEVFGSVLYLSSPELTENCIRNDDKLELEGFIPDQIIYADTTVGRWMENSLQKLKQAEPKIVDEDTSTVYIWHFKNMPPLVFEPRMPDFGDVVPNLNCSVLNDWEYIFDWLGNFQKARIKITPEIEQKTMELIAEAKTIEEKIDRIYRWVQRNIQYISIKGSVSSGQTGHPAEETFHNGYGDCTDKSILFCTMLKVIGIEAHPVILMTNSDETVDRCIPDISGNHAITKLFMPDGEEKFLDPTSTTYKFPYFRSDDIGVSYVDAIGRTVGLIPENPPQHYLERIAVDMQIQPNGDATAEFKSTPIGMLEAAYRGFWEWQQPERYEMIFANWMNSIFPEADLDSFKLIGISDMDSQLVEWAKVSVDSFPAETEDIWILTIPGIERSMRGFNEINLTERKYDIEYTCPSTDEYSVEIELPKGARVIELPENVELTCEPYADFFLKFNQKGNKILVNSRFRLKTRIIPAYHFEVYKKFIISAKQATEKRLFVKKPK